MDTTDTGARSDAVDLERRFGGVARLYGRDALSRFGRARIAVVGIGGVGTWAVEALARSGAGNLTLIDLDHIAESNVNRQIHALDPDFGKSKVAAMAQRVMAIHPAAQVREVEEFASSENVAALLHGHDLVLDCIDQALAKAAIAAHGVRHGIAVITCGAAGGRRNPGRVRHDDLAFVRGDALLARVRQLLRRDYGFPAGGGSRRSAAFRIAALYCDEPMVRTAAGSGSSGAPLSCAGYGSAVTVTATMGFAAAALALERISKA